MYNKSNIFLNVKTWIFKELKLYFLVTYRRIFWKKILFIEKFTLKTQTFFLLVFINLILLVTY